MKERCFGVELEAEVSRLWGLVAGLSRCLVCYSSVVHISDAVSWVFGYGKAIFQKTARVWQATQGGSFLSLSLHYLGPISGKCLASSWEEVMVTVGDTFFSQL